MQYRQVGKNGLRVSVIGLGSWLTLGGTVEEQKGKNIIFSSFENGITFFDTADVYAHGDAEKFYGKILKEFRRPDLVIATKCFWPMSDNPNDKGLSRKHIIESVNASLKRLQTDYIDIEKCHRYDESTPVEETCRAFNSLIEQGKILYWGTSEWTKEQIQDAVELCEKYNLHKPISNQPQYSLLARDIEKNGVLDYCDDAGIGQVVWSPLAQGILTGKYNRQRDEKKGRLYNEKQSIFMKRFVNDENMAKVDKLLKISSDLGHTAASVALAWCLRKNIVSSVITSATNEDQLEENLKASEISLPDDAISELNSIFI
jgi:voltage-dependent potassium channel beta subunit